MGLGGSPGEPQMTGEKIELLIRCHVLCPNPRYITQNIDYSYTFELPEHDKDGAHGFLLPASNIVKVSRIRIF